MAAAAADNKYDAPRVFEQAKGSYACDDESGKVGAKSHGKSITFHAAVTESASAKSHAVFPAGSGAAVVSHRKRTGGGKKGRGGKGKHGTSSEGGPVSLKSTEDGEVFLASDSLLGTAKSKVKKGDTDWTAQLHVRQFKEYDGFAAVTDSKTQSVDEIREMVRMTQGATAVMDQYLEVVIKNTQGGMKGLVPNSSAMTRQTSLDDSKKIEISMPVIVSAPDATKDYVVSNALGIKFYIPEVSMIKALRPHFPKISACLDQFRCLIKDARLADDATSTLFSGGGATRVVLHTEMTEPMWKNKDSLNGDWEHDTKRMAHWRAIAAFAARHARGDSEHERSARTSIEVERAHAQKGLAEAKSHMGQDGSVASMQAVYSAQYEKFTNELKELKVREDKLDADVTARHSKERELQKDERGLAGNTIMGYDEDGDVENVSVRISKTWSEQQSTNLTRAVESMDALFKKQGFVIPAEVDQQPNPLRPNQKVNRKAGHVRTRAVYEVMNNCTFVESTGKMMKSLKGAGALFTPDAVAVSGREGESIYRISEQLCSVTDWEEQFALDYQRCAAMHPNKADCANAYRFYEKRIPMGLFEMIDPAVPNAHDYNYGTGTGTVEFQGKPKTIRDELAGVAWYHSPILLHDEYERHSKDENKATATQTAEQHQWQHWVDWVKTGKVPAGFGTFPANRPPPIDYARRTFSVDRHFLMQFIAKIESKSRCLNTIVPLKNAGVWLIPEHTCVIKAARLRPGATATDDPTPRPADYIVPQRGVFAATLIMNIIPIGDSGRC